MVVYNDAWTITKQEHLGNEKPQFSRLRPSWGIESLQDRVLVEALIVNKIVS